MRLLRLRPEEKTLEMLSKIEIQRDVQFRFRARVICPHVARCFRRFCLNRIDSYVLIGYI